MARCLEGGILLPGPVHILGVWLRRSLQLEQNWLEVQAKVDAPTPKVVVLKGVGGGVHHIHLPLDPLVFVLPLSKNRQLVLQQSLSKLLWGG